MPKHEYSTSRSAELPLKGDPRLEAAAPARPQNAGLHFGNAA